MWFLSGLSGGVTPPLIMAMMRCRTGARQGVTWLLQIPIFLRGVMRSHAGRLWEVTVFPSNETYFNLSSAAISQELYIENWMLEMA